MTHWLAARAYDKMNIGIILPNWIGDCVMASPMLRAIRRRWPAPHRLVGVMRPYVADVLRGTEWLDESIPYDRRSDEPGGRFNGVIQQLRQRDIDVMLLMTNSLSSAWLAWRGGARQRIGYARGGRSLLLTHRLRAQRERRRFKPMSAVDYYLELAYALDCPLERRRLELATTPEDESSADRVWRKFQLDPAAGVAVLSTGGAFGAAKRWPDDYFAQLARRIALELNYAVLVICGPAERQAAAQIAEQAQHPNVHSLAHEPLSIGLSKACVRRGDVMVATDSGPRHFAAAFGVPVVSLFGPTDPRWSINYHAGEVRLWESLPCSPCQKRVCPLGHHDCMRNLHVERVMQAVRQKIESQPMRRAA